MPESLDNNRKRVLFRSHHTGMKENDHLFGGFADENLTSMTDEDVAWFESLLMNHNDIDLYNWMMEKEPVPPNLNHPVMERLLAFKNALSAR